MFLGFKKSDANSKYNLLINLRSNNISFALYSENDNKSKIEFVLNSVSANNTPILKTLEEGLKKIISEGLVSLSENSKIAKITSVKVVLGAKFYECYIKDLVIEKDQPFILTKDQFNKAIEKHAEIISAESAGKLILERDVTNVTINGYSLKNPFGKKTNKLAVSFYASFVEKKLIEDIEKVIKDQVHTKKILFKTYTLNLFNVLRNGFLNINNYTSIDVSENQTDVFIVENNGLKYRKSFDFGYKNFIDEIAEKCSINPEIAVSEIKMYIVGELKKTCKPEIDQGITDQKKKWVNLFVSEIVDKQGINIPSRVFLTTNKKVSDIFIQTLTEAENKTAIFRNDKDITVINCENKHFSQQVSYKDSLESDIFITINSINLED